MKLELRESKLIRDGDRWFVNGTVQKEARLKQRYVTILPVDVGTRKLATTIEDGKSVAPHKIVKAIKGRSSNMLRKEFPEHCKLCVEAQSKK
jgi:transposase